MWTVVMQATCYQGNYATKTDDGAEDKTPLQMLNVRKSLASGE